MHFYYANFLLRLGYFNWSGPEMDNLYIEIGLELAFQITLQNRK